MIAVKAINLTLIQDAARILQLKGADSYRLLYYTKKIIVFIRFYALFTSLRVLGVLGVMYVRLRVQDVRQRVLEVNVPCLMPLLHSSFLFQLGPGGQLLYLHDLPLHWAY